MYKNLGWGRGGSVTPPMTTLPPPYPQPPTVCHKDACLRLVHKESPCLDHNVGVWQGKTEALWSLGSVMEGGGTGERLLTLVS